jgi:DnaK suppressor protein
MNTERFKQRLLIKEHELLSEIASLEGDARVSGDAEVRDTTDDATAQQGTSEALQEEGVASRMLIEVQDALKRIEDGTYGKCTVCGRPIEPARLEAVPWARYCLEDQEKIDKATHAQHGGSTL